MRLKLLIIALIPLFAARLHASETPTALAPREIMAFTGERSLRVTFVVFSTRDYTLRVIDNAGANEASRFPRVAMAMNSLGAAAGCNGGFFERYPFAPVGLMVADKTRTGTFDAKSWMKGLIVVRTTGLRLENAESFLDGPDITQLVQTGPWLVRAGQSEVLAGKPMMARRTFFCHGESDLWAIGISESCTLAELATALTSEPAKSVLPIQEALNLDGGPSTGLWAKTAAGEFSSPERWSVRNYLAIFPRAP